MWIQNKILRLYKSYNFNRMINQYVKTFIGNEKYKLIELPSKNNKSIYLIFTLKNKYILKVTTSEIIDREVYAYKVLAGNISLPVIYKYTDKMIIEEYMDGVLLANLNIQNNKITKIYEDIGRSLNTIHKTQLDFQKVKYEYNLKNRIERNVGKLIGSLRNVVNENLYEKVEKFVQNNIDAISRKNCLLHGDFIPDNIIISENQFQGIIDFGDKILSIVDKQ